MISKDQWLAQAKSLAFGKRRKITCCGSSPSMIVAHTERGYTAHCFRDSSHGGFVPHGTLSLAELQKRRQDSLILAQSRWSGLPDDFTYDIPPASMLWLLKSSIGYAHSRLYGIGYSPRTARVVVPVRTLDGELIAFLARATDNTNPKYIARYKEDDASAVFTSLPDVQGPFDLVITEDCLSTIRVGKYNRTRSLLGTSTDAAKTMSLLEGIPKVQRAALWLDGDKAGRKGRDKVAKQLSLLGVEVTKITTPKDPKLYTNREIQEILTDARSRTT